MIEYSVATEQAIERLKAVARTDPAASPLALLEAEVLQTASDSVWDAAVPALKSVRLQNGFPLLHGQTLPINANYVRNLLSRFEAIRVQAGSVIKQQSVRLRQASDVDLLSFLEASIEQDSERLATEAAAAEVDQALLVTLGQLVVLPLLHACGRRAAPLLEVAHWEAGYCPVCAAWPTLAEIRGVERRRWLRCGRCGSGWPYSSHLCVFCGNEDHRTQGYLAPENDWESRRATTCDQCRGYLKTLATMVPIEPLEIALHDLNSLELDLAAVERDYARPSAPSTALGIKVVSAQGRGN